MAKDITSTIGKHLKGFGMYYYILALVVIFGFETIAR